jgi:hypothetical protein
MVYFDASKLPDPEDAYVAWIDVMGVRAYMRRSLCNMDVASQCRLYAVGNEIIEGNPELEARYGRP